MIDAQKHYFGEKKISKILTYEAFKR